MESPTVLTEHVPSQTELRIDSSDSPSNILDENQTPTPTTANTSGTTHGENKLPADGETSNAANEVRTDHDAFECNICFETAKDAIVTLCGHLFCWPCLHAWLEQKPPGIQTCPVCKSVVDRDRVVPLYGRGNQRSSTAGGNQQAPPVDPRTKTDPDASTASVPNRPRGQWQQAPPNQDDYFMPFFGTRPGGVHVSFGIGSFPFGFLNATIGGNIGVDQQVDPSLMSTLFLLLGMLLVAWVIFA